VTDSAELTEAVQHVLFAVLHDSGHDVADCRRFYGDGRPAQLIADGDGTQLAVCPCSVSVEIPGGLEVQMQARGLTPGAAPPAAADPVQPGLPLIDPSEIVTPEQLEAHLLDVIKRLETGQLYERECIEAEYRARLAWEMAKAKQIAKGGAAADVRMAAALAEHGDLYEAYLLAEMMRKAVQAAMHNCRSMLSGYQTVARSVLTTYQAGGSPGPNNQPQRGRY
jgi:hypothetical protein